MYSDAFDAALFTTCFPSDDNVCPDSNDDADVALRRRLISENSSMLLYIPLLCPPPSASLAKGQKGVLVKRNLKEGGKSGL
jgi:hypothetical protein